MISLNCLWFWVWSVMVAYSSCQQPLLDTLSGQVRAIVDGQQFPSTYPIYASARELFRPPLTYLFTPNTLKERPESSGQQEEYRKYLKEEAEEMEKERQQNEIDGNFNPLDYTQSGALEPGRKTFVRVNIMGNNYGYSS